MKYGNRVPDQTIGYMADGSILGCLIDSKTDREIGGYFALGNISSALANFTIEKVEMLDHQYGTNSVVMSKVTKQNGELTLTLSSVSAKNVAIGIFGNLVEDVADPAAVFIGKAYKGTSVVVDGVIENLTSITNAMSMTLVEDVDFIVSDCSVYFTDEANITDGESVEILYSKAAVSRIEGMVKGSVKLKLVFQGFNTANEDRAVKVTYHKVSLDPAAQRQLITKEFGSLELKGTIEVSRAVTGSGLSKMFKEEHVG